MSIDQSNSVHPTAIIGEGVIMGTGNKVGPNAVITGNTRIGDDNWIGAGAVIGAIPEYRAINHHDQNIEFSLEGVLIGSRNVIREAVQIHQGLKRPTEILNDTFLMNQVYVAHDCRLENGVTLASSVLLAGTVTVQEKANLGMGASVHQGTIIGRLAMVGMGTVVVADVPKYSKVYGVPGRIQGFNQVGLERAGFDANSIRAIQEIFSCKLPAPDIIAQLENIEGLNI